MIELLQLGRKMALQRTVRGSEGSSEFPPPVEGQCNSSCRIRAPNIVRDFSHPLHEVCDLVPSDKQYHNIRSGTLSIFCVFTNSIEISQRSLLLFYPTPLILQTNSDHFGFIFVFNSNLFIWHI
ncbi:hypothetical protein GOODEAATRI_014036 [Goodea atripinnis]|uniref:Uncharacterized protein n=1 Tax=Goodea atripinnis TaxID=208336 RepID=A0ABV0NAI2_9TELE